MVSRCCTETAGNFHKYGAAGIGICAGWRSFENFYADLGDRPGGMSIDRERSADGYWCGQCDECMSLGRKRNGRWATTRQQSLNRPGYNVLLTLGARTQAVAAWARELGIDEQTIHSRLRAGWGPEKTLTTPPAHTNHRETVLSWLATRGEARLSDLAMAVYGSISERTRRNTGQLLQDLKRMGLVRRVAPGRWARI